MELICQFFYYQNFKCGNFTKPYFFSCFPLFYYLICLLYVGEKLLKKLRSIEKPTSIPREKIGVLHLQMTSDENDENDDFTIEDDLPTRRRNNISKVKRENNQPTIKPPNNPNKLSLGRRRLRTISGDDLLLDDSRGMPKKKRNTNEEVSQSESCVKLKHNVLKPIVNSTSVSNFL